MKNHTDMLIFHTAICAGASQIAIDGRRELDVLVATPSLRSGMEINMLTVYCYDKCTTCKKALKWLDDRNIPYDKKDIKTDHPDEKTLRKLWQTSGMPLKRFFNTSGMIYREMELSKKLPNMGEDEQIKLLASDGMLVKRPLAVGDGYVMVGFKEAEWKEKF